jgi:DNA invertase Pin-like site-specific DNA recombinase
MEVALYARVSTSQQQHEGTIESQRRSLKHHIQHHGWSLRLCRKFCSGGYEETVAPVGGGLKQPGSRTVRPR